MSEVTENSSFLLQAVELLVGAGYVGAEARGIHAERDKALAIIHAWPMYAKLATYATQADAVDDFQSWVLFRWVGGQPSIPIATFSVSISFRMPQLANASEITIGLSAKMPAHSNETRARAFEWLQQQINEQLEQVQIRQGIVSSGPVQSTVGRLERIKVLAIRTEVLKTGRVHKVVGGDFTAYGLRVYEEALRAVGIDPEKLPVGDIVPKLSWLASVKRNGAGKAYCVGELIRDE